MQVSALIRKFRYAGLDLPDIDPLKSPDEIRKAYAASYPELTTASVEALSTEGATQFFEFKRAVGTKG